ncbi:MAG: iron ABC transporter permease [Anaerolineae bacterium]|nr:iron ABC transporter permease [Anaerolineae bacterium]
MANSANLNSRPPQSQVTRRLREFALIARDPVLLLSLVFCGLFLFIFVFYPLFKTTANGFFNAEGALDLKYFGRFFDNYYGPLSRRIFQDTMVMGLLTALGGTLVGFIFAYAVVRCNIPGRRWIHILALVPTVSPPFAIALSTILLFGRNGLITRRLLGITVSAGSNDIYGMDGLVLVQVITFFSAAYLILKAMLERVEPSLEEAAESMGANRFHLFRTVTIPLLTPGLAASFLLLFVEALADLGNPLFISGNVMVLSTQIFLAVSGEYDFQKASALALVLLLPTLIIFLIQRYYVSRRSYVSVTGKPTGGRIVEKEPLIRWFFIGLTYLFCAFILLLYVTIIYSSFAKTWGVDFRPTLEWWKLMVTRGIEPIMDTTFLSVVATPVAALTGMVIAFLVVRKSFTGKNVLDFGSNLGGAVPGTILGIGFVLAFSTPPMIVVVILYALCALLLVRNVFKQRREQLLVLLLGTAVGVGLSFLDEVLGLIGLYYLLGALLVGFGLFTWFKRRRRRLGQAYMAIGGYMLAYDLIEYVASPIAVFSRSLPRGFWSNAVFQISDHLKVLFQLTPALLGLFMLLAAILLLEREHGRWRVPLGVALLAIPCALIFTDAPLVMIGGPFIIIAAFAVRSLPASVRAGVAALQQIDPSIEEASNILGADAQTTFRKVTLPLILPALLAGLIFSFTRHMTSLSAIIFLVSARWRVVTAAILSEWEQGGVSIAAAYSTTIILFVLVAIGVLNYLTNRVLRGRGDVDLSMGM